MAGIAPAAEGRHRRRRGAGRLRTTRRPPAGGPGQKGAVGFGEGVHAEAEEPDGDVGGPLGRDAGVGREDDVGRVLAAIDAEPVVRVALGREMARGELREQLVPQVVLVEKDHGGGGRPGKRT